MKKFTLILVILFSAFTISIAQNQIENPGFEEWEAITNEFEEPVNWSTVKTCVPENLAAFAPVTVNKCDSAPHSGNYCVHIFTVDAAFNITATGNLTNGRVFANVVPDDGYMFIDVNDDRWNTKIDYRPDSLTGWFRAMPKGEDHGVVKILLATDSASLPTTDSLNWVGFGQFELPSGNIEEWTRFSTPITYFNEKTPKYFLCVLISSIGVSATSGSEMWIDDLSLAKATGIEELTEGDVNIYTIGKNLNIYIDDIKSQNALIRIIDLKGVKVYESMIKTRQKTQLEPDVKNGMYIVTLNIESKVISKKVLINR